MSEHEVCDYYSSTAVQPECAVTQSLRGLVFSPQNAASSGSNVPERHLRKRMRKTYNVLQGIVSSLAVKYCRRFTDHKLSQEPPMSRRSHSRKSIALIHHTGVAEIIYYELYFTYSGVKYNAVIHLLVRCSQLTNK